MTANRWPDFIVLGAGKSGTTALNEYLDQHPSIFMSPRKEPNFFGLENVDLDSYEIEESKQYHLESVYRKEDYLALFKGAGENQITGEISNLYLYSEIAHLNIKKYAPDAKLLVLLRQPAERLFSRYLHLVRDNRLPQDNWDDLFNQDTIWWKRPDLVNEGFYFKHLSRYYDHFPKENIRVYLYDDYKVDPNKVLKDIFSFVGVDDKVIVDTDIVVNKSGRRKKNLFNMMLGQDGLLVNFTKALAPQLHERLRKNKDVIKYLNKARNKHIITTKLDEDLRTRITNEIYRDDIIALGELLNRDLSGWLSPRRLKVESVS